MSARRESFGPQMDAVSRRQHVSELRISMRPHRASKRVALAMIAVLSTIGCGLPPAATQAVVVEVPPPKPSKTSAAPHDSTEDEQPDVDAGALDEKRHCSPLPKVGSPCLPTQSYCVVDWGSPGGSSTALWCRDGTWHRIEESNER